MAATAVSNVARPRRMPTVLTLHSRSQPLGTPSAKALKPVAPSRPPPLLVTAPVSPKTAQRRSLTVCSAGSAATKATVFVGDEIPEATLTYVDSDGELGTTTVSELTAGKKVTIVAIPGGLTATFATLYLPGCLEYSDKLRTRGVDMALVAVNGGWAFNQSDKVRLLNDGKAEFARAMGFPPDFISGDFGRNMNLGPNFMRGFSQPYTIQVYVENGVVQAFEYERMYEAGGIDL